MKALGLCDLHELHRILDRPAVRHPVGCRNAKANDHPVAHAALHGIHHFAGKAHAVLERPAVFVDAGVREGREELVNEVAVGHVDLNSVHAGALSALCGLAEGIGHPRAVVEGEHAGLRVAFVEGNGRRRAHGPAAVHRLHRFRFAVPGLRHARLAAGVIELHHHAAGGFDFMHEVDELLEACLAFIRPEAEIGLRNAAFRRHRHGFDADEARSGRGEVAVVHLVKELRHAALGAVHAHRRNRNAVRNRHRTELDRRKKHGIHKSLRPCLLQKMEGTAFLVR